VRQDAPLVQALGPRTAKALEDGLGLRTAGDLLRHYPRRYAERGQLTPVGDLRDGDHVTVVGEVVSSSVRTARSGKQLGEVVITDGSGRLRLTFFGRAARWNVDRLKAGRRGLFGGTVSTFNGQRQLTHPEVALDEDVEDLPALLPVYPASKDIASWNVAKAVQTVLGQVELGDDPLPEHVRRARGLAGLREALERIHRPEGWPDVHRARARLVWDEAFVLQVVLAQRRAALAATPATPRPPRAGGLVDAFDARLPFALTEGQRSVGEVLDAELSRSSPMHRLLQGEVGSGKTLVALRAMLRVVDAGGQAALLAPTEVLAQQHARSLRDLLGPLAEAGRLGGAQTATRVALLTGSLPAAARREALLEAASGQAGIVVGTHALLEQRVQFADLGLVVVDEQHRFGVEQRDALRSKGAVPPHVLVMTATPIPRTVAMTVYGDLETSTLTELPRGRSPISTFVVGGSGRAFDRTWEKVREEVAAGHQAFVVCPRIGGDPDEPAEPSEDGRRPAAAVEEVLPLLQAGPLSGLRVEPLHGRMAPEAKDDVMRRFSGGDVDVLVATTVVEVGVDVPNATVMVVLDADRFGVSQLHQLRGRIGRGSAPGLCVLVTEVEPESPSGERLQAVASTTDGFALSRVDLEQRREGDVLGAAQSGRRSSLRLLQLAEHEELIGQARAVAAELVAGDPDLSGHPALARAVEELVDPERAEYLEKA
jgi:ATP-dependent DNA helicase RecG